MKSNQLIALAAIIGTCGFATAQEAPPARPKREIPPQILKKYDKDGDGKLSADEHKAMQEDRKAVEAKRRAENLKNYDKDGDGKLSEDERKTMHDERDAKRKALIAKYDANKDGKLNADEAKTARDAGEEIPPAGRGPGGRRDKGEGPEGGPPPPPAPPAGE